MENNQIKFISSPLIQLTIFSLLILFVYLFAYKSFQTIRELKSANTKLIQSSSTNKLENISNTVHDTITKTVTLHDTLTRHDTIHSTITRHDTVYVSSPLNKKLRQLEDSLRLLSATIGNLGKIKMDFKNNIDKSFQGLENRLRSPQYEDLKKRVSLMDTYIKDLIRMIRNY